MARNTAKVALVIRLRTKIRTTRGLNCPAAICTATSEMLKTTPMKVIMAALIVVTTVFASSAIPSRSLTASSSPASRSAVRIASSAAVAAAHTTNDQDQSGGRSEPERVPQMLPQRRQSPVPPSPAASPSVVFQSPMVETVGAPSADLSGTPAGARIRR